MIIALLLSYLFFGGSSSMLALQGHSPADIENAVKRVVTDDNRKRDAQEVVVEWKKALKVQDEAAIKDQKELLKALKRQNSTRAEVDQLDAKLDATFHEMDRTFLDSRSRFKDFLTKKEWNDLSVRLNKG